MKRLLRRCLGMFLIFAVSVTATGCWDKIEVNDRSFVNIVTTDIGSKKDEVEVGLGFPLPNRMVPGDQGGTASKGKPYMLVKQQGESVAIAFRKIQSNMSRHINWGHVRVILVSRRMAEQQGIRPILEFVSRLPSFHLKTFIFVTPYNFQLEKVVPIFERFASEIIREFANQRRTLDTTAKDALQAISEDRDYLISMLSYGKKPAVSEDGKTVGWIGTDGAAMFREDKMVGALDQKGMRAAMWIEGRMKNAVISVRSPTDNKLVSLLILSSNAKIKPIVQGDSIKFRIEVRAVDDMLSTESNLNVMDPGITRQLEADLSEGLQDRIEKTIQQSKKAGVDILQLSKYIEWHYPKKWKQVQSRWRDEYRDNVEVEPKVDIIIKRPGAEKNPVWVKPSGQEED